ncbi:MAG: metal ABC transporter ATP-binding protein [Lactococcus raffinolactis]|jgi:manganese transport system ATP-binding protein|uniref:ATP-binding cassette domain-containing protein n=1 Tax=Pseudolactococcus raffinolactis TaxID=1366 RepID=A0A2A5S843_9LACT|nr:metal ABC transporter ATP-binding protein [Lactococcus raffinolactis]MBP6300680.1 metal ABC transporter ATP-binding protein [Lactococcus sp.]MDN5434966.1 metal ABC transporter ATP-binding protein [Acinetobacter sp.]ATC61847.1 manganese ABC transporter ATP-binding protein [Lactococcus raffinolactis]MBP6984591.1 metal ABC transporter ATP-binding protein [Lactococcus sp.]MBR2542544.1 metal ABC transporter ATP-binding protein [Lactococcus sp.]
MFEIKNLTVAYQGELILDQVSLTVQKGKITGIIGPNGAGKSTLIKGALGLIKCQSGQTYIQGESLAKVRDQIAYVEQRSAVDLTFPINVLDLVLTGTYPKLGLFKSPGPLEKQAALEALAQVDLVDFKERQIGSLSGGQLQRVFVARAIVQDATVIILDEPFVGIDMSSEQKIMGILKKWSDVGKTIIVVNHDLNKVTQYFDDLVIIQRGIVAQGPVTETYQMANIQKAFSLDFGKLLFEQDMTGDSEDHG